MTQKRHPLAGGDYIRTSTGLRQVEQSTAAPAGKSERKRAEARARKAAPSPPAAPPHKS